MHQSTKAMVTFEELKALVEKNYKEYGADVINKIESNV